MAVKHENRTVEKVSSKDRLDKLEKRMKVFLNRPLYKRW